MRRDSTSLAVMLLAVAALVGAIALPVALLREDGAPGPSPAPGRARVSVSAGEVRTIPQLSPERKQELIGTLAGALGDLYERAFLSGRFDPGEDAPTPTPSTAVDELFTDSARQALREDPDVFRLKEPLEVGDGTVRFGGVVTLEDGSPVHALLEVEFLADATPEQGAEPVVRLRQIGSLLLVSRPQGWRVASFDLAFSTRPQPTPR